MDDNSYDTIAMAATRPGADPIARLVEAIRSLSNDNQLADVQKPIATRYLAIRNAHGDFRPKPQPNAFFKCEVKKEAEQWKVKGTQLAKGITSVRLLNGDGTNLTEDVPVSGSSFTKNLDSEEAAKALALVEAYDTPGILLQLGIPNLIKP